MKGFGRSREAFQCQVVLRKSAKPMSNEFLARLGTQFGSLWKQKFTCVRCFSNIALMHQFLMNFECFGNGQIEALRHLKLRFDVGKIEGFI